MGYQSKLLRLSVEQMAQKTEVLDDEDEVSFLLEREDYRELLFALFEYHYLTSDFKPYERIASLVHWWKRTNSYESKFPLEKSTHFSPLHNKFDSSDLSCLYLELASCQNDFARFNIFYVYRKWLKNIEEERSNANMMKWPLLFKYMKKYSGLKQLILMNTEMLDCMKQACGENCVELRLGQLQEKTSSIFPLFSNWFSSQSYNATSGKISNVFQNFGRGKN